MTEWLCSLPSNHVALTTVGLNPNKGFGVSFHEEAIHLGYETLVVSLGHPLGHLRSLSTSKSCTNRHMNYTMSVRLKTKHNKAKIKKKKTNQGFQKRKRYVKYT